MGTTGNVTTEFNYDDLGRPTLVTDPDGGREYTLYDPSGLPVLTIDPAGRTRVLLHVVYAYDGTGRRVYMWDGYGPTFYQYDPMGRLQEERGLQELVTYTYDPASRLTAMTSHLGTTEYGYDAGNRLSWVRDPLGNQTDYTYDPDYGHLASVRLPLGTPNFVTRQDTYHQLSDGRMTRRMQQITFNKTIGGTPSQVWQGTYTYDLPGMIRTFADSTAPNHTYHYDQAHRLTQADGASGNSSHPNDRYVYDAAGNRTTTRIPAAAPSLTGTSRSIRTMPTG